jgi:hypothetical protein
MIADSISWMAIKILSAQKHIVDFMLHSACILTTKANTLQDLIQWIPILQSDAVCGTESSSFLFFSLHKSDFSKHEVKCKELVIKVLIIWHWYNAYSL